MVNVSGNLTSVSLNKTSAVHNKYVFMPDDHFIAKVIIYTVIAALNLYAIVANSLILYFNKRRQTQNARNPRAFDRFPAFSIYIQSLVSSDFLYCIITFPVAIATNFWDITNNDMACKVVRFTNIFFPVVTMCNLFVIGIERYLAVFHPFKVPSKRVVRGLVLGAWVAGGLITLVPSATYRIQTRDIGPDSYTKICMYVKTVPIYKVMFVGFTVFIYFIPSIILTLTSLRILVFLQRRKKSIAHNASNNDLSRFYGASIFVTLIFSFVLPYLLYVFFSAINMIFKLNLSSTAELIFRRISGLLAYSNSAISPSVMLYHLPDDRRELSNFVRKKFGLLPKHVQPSTSNAIEGCQDPNTSKNLPCTSEKPVNSDMNTFSHPPCAEIEEHRDAKS